MIADRPRAKPVANKPTRIKRFEQRPGLHKPKPMRGGLIVLLIFGALLYWAYTGGSRTATGSTHAVMKSLTVPP